MKALSPQQSRYLDWWLAPEAERDPPLQKDWCRREGVSAETVRRWRNQPVFVKEWSERVTATVGSPQRVKSIMDTLYESVLESGDVTAAKYYMSHLERVAPPARLDTGDDLADLSDSELAALAVDLGLVCPECGFGLSTAADAATVSSTTQVPQVPE